MEEEIAKFEKENPPMSLKNGENAEWIEWLERRTKIRDLLLPKEWVPTPETVRDQMGLVGTMSIESNVTWILHFVSNDFPVPEYFRGGAHMNNFLKHLGIVYWDPISFNATVRKHGDRKRRPAKFGLTLSQFELFTMAIEKTAKLMRLPLNRAPPEYWYTYAYMKSAINGIAQNMHMDIGWNIRELEEIDQIQIENKLSYDPWWSTFSKTHKTDYWRLNSVLGDPSMPGFVFRPSRMVLTDDIYRTAPDYWDFLSTRSCNTYNTSQIVPVLRVSLNKLKNTLKLPTVVSEEEEWVNDEAKEDKLKLDIVEKEDRFIGFVPIAEKEPRERVTETCSCGKCVDSRMSEVAGCYDKSEWSKVLTQLELVKPIDEVDYIGKENGKELTSDLQEEIQVPVNGNEESVIMTDEHLWCQYLVTESFVSSHVNSKFYDLALYSDQVTDQIDMDLTHWKKNTKKAFPRTFKKFVWLYNQIGLLPSLNDGSLILGAKAPLTNKVVLEIGSAPYGSMASLLESGVITTYYHTEFPGEQFPDSPYDQMGEENLQKTGVCFGSKLIKVGMKGGVDIDSYAKLISGKLGEVEKDISPTVSMLVVDIPLKRNSVLAYSLAEHYRDRKTGSLGEFVDDRPLGRRQAMSSLINLVSIVTQICLERGGTLVFKIMEVWTMDLTDLIWHELASKFETVKLLQNPHSKALSKELYFVGIGWNKGFVAYGVFFSMMRDLVTYQVVRLTHQLILMARKHGKKYQSKRIISCRSKLFNLVSKFVLDKEIVDMFPEFNPKYSWEKKEEDFSYDVLKNLRMRPLGPSQN